jgi:hypothetical protein
MPARYPLRPVAGIIREVKREMNEKWENKNLFKSDTLGRIGLGSLLLRLHSRRISEQQEEARKCIALNSATVIPMIERTICA